MSAFYAKAFGWKTQDLGPEMGHYVLVQTSETGQDNFPTERGRINGGFFGKTKDNQAPSVVISVDDIRQSMDKVRQAGGNVLGDPMDIPGVGKYVSFMDPEGNRVSMLQPLPRQG